MEGPGLSQPWLQPVSMGERETWQEFPCEPWPLGWAGVVTLSAWVAQSLGGGPDIQSPYVDFLELITSLP